MEKEIVSEVDEEVRDFEEYPVVPDGINVITKVAEDGTVSLIIKNTLPHQTGYYKCVASNPMGDAQTEGKVTVIGKHTAKVAL